MGSIFKSLHDDADYLGGKANEEPLSRFLTVLAASLHGRSTLNAVERAANELALFDAIDNPRHWQMAMKLMLRHKHVFFNNAIRNNWETLSEKQRDEIATESSPVVRTVWLLCTMVARELFEGEHTLTPQEALVLGLVDEVPGSTLLRVEDNFPLKMRKHMTQKVKIKIPNRISRRLITRSTEYFSTCGDCAAPHRSDEEVHAMSLANLHGEYATVIHSNEAANAAKSGSQGYRTASEPPRIFVECPDVKSSLSWPQSPSSCSCASCDLSR